MKTVRVFTTVRNEVDPQNFMSSLTLNLLLNLKECLHGSRVYFYTYIMYNI